MNFPLRPGRGNHFSAPLNRQSSLYNATNSGDCTVYGLRYNRLSISAAQLREAIMQWPLIERLRVHTEC